VAYVEAGWAMEYIRDVNNVKKWSLVEYLTSSRLNLSSLLESAY